MRISTEELILRVATIPALRTSKMPRALFAKDLVLIMSDSYYSIGLGRASLFNRRHRLNADVGVFAVSRPFSPKPKITEESCEALVFGEVCHNIRRLQLWPPSRLFAASSVKLL
jgi:hypothetical protein